MTQFCAELGLFGMGMPVGNLRVCRETRDKGAIAAEVNLSAFVDNNSDVLQSISRESPTTKLFHYDNSCRRAGELPADTTMLTRPSAWWRLADYCSLPRDSELWDEIGAAGPPTRPHSSRTLQWVRDSPEVRRVLAAPCRLVPAQPAGRLPPSPEAGRRLVPTQPAGPPPPSAEAGRRRVPTQPARPPPPSAEAGRCLVPTQPAGPPPQHIMTASAKHHTPPAKNPPLPLKKCSVTTVLLFLLLISAFRFSQGC